MKHLKRITTSLTWNNYQPKDICYSLPEGKKHKPQKAIDYHITLNSYITVRFIEHFTTFIPD